MYLLLAGLLDGPRHGYAIAQLAREIDRVAAEVARRTEERLASRWRGRSGLWSAPRWCRRSAR